MISHAGKLLLSHTSRWEIAVIGDGNDTFCACVACGDIGVIASKNDACSFVSYFHFPMIETQRLSAREMITVRTTGKYVKYFVCPTTENRWKSYHFSLVMERYWSTSGVLLERHWSATGVLPCLFLSNMTLLSYLLALPPSHILP